MMCEKRPYPGAGYWCYLEAAEHERQEAAGAFIIHTDLTLCWRDDGTFCNADGRPI